MSENPPSSGITRKPRIPVPQQPPGAYRQRYGRTMIWLIWFQTIALALICAGCLVLFLKFLDAHALNARIGPLFANLAGATLLVGLMQLIARRNWPWQIVGLLILLLSSLGLWLTLKLVGMVAG